MKRSLKITIRIIVILIAVAVLACIGGYIYIKINSSHLLRFSEGITEKVIKLEDIPDAAFIKGMNGCENLYLDENSQRVYVTDLHGYIHMLNGKSWKTLKINKSKKLGEYLLGIDKGPGGWLYVNVCESAGEGWLTEGGAVWRIGPELTSPKNLTGNYKCINGLAVDNDNNLYFASAIAGIMNPDGNIYKARIRPDGNITKPEIFISDAGWANGLYFNEKENLLYFSNTIEGCFSITPGIAKLTPVYYKTRIMESIDDLCTDAAGRIWMTDPGRSTVKVFDPETGNLIRYDFTGIGQTSSCRIRMEQGEEILYITELKQSRDVMKQVFDGRGLLVMPVKSLEKL